MATRVTGTQCPRCKRDANDPILTNCMCIYCTRCIVDLTVRSFEQGESHFTCRKCKPMFVFTAQKYIPGFQYESVRPSDQWLDKRQGQLDAYRFQKKHFGDAHARAMVKKFVSVPNVFADPLPAQRASIAENKASLALPVQPNSASTSPTPLSIGRTAYLPFLGNSTTQPIPPPSWSETPRGLRPSTSAEYTDVLHQPASPSWSMFASRSVKPKVPSTLDVSTPNANLSVSRLQLRQLAETSAGLRTKAEDNSINTPVKTTNPEKKPFATPADYSSTHTTTNQNQRIHVSSATAISSTNNLSETPIDDKTAFKAKLKNPQIEEATDTAILAHLKPQNSVQPSKEKKAVKPSEAFATALPKHCGLPAKTTIEKGWDFVNMKDIKEEEDEEWILVGVEDHKIEDLALTADTLTSPDKFFTVKRFTLGFMG